MRNSTNKPHDNQSNGKSAANTIDAAALKHSSGLNGSKSKTSIRKDKRPPVQRELHLLDASKDRNRRYAEEPEGKENEEEASQDADELDDIADWDGSDAKVLSIENFGRLASERDEACCSVSGGSDRDVHTRSGRGGREGADHEPLRINGVHQHGDTPSDTLEHECEMPY